MSWAKSPPELAALFDRALPNDARVERRKMFGYPAAFTGGRMFAGLHQEALVLKLGEDDRAELRERHGGVPFEPLPGRSMRAFVALPAPLNVEESVLRDFLARALDHVATLPAKPATAKRPARRKA